MPSRRTRTFTNAILPPTTGAVSFRRVLGARVSISVGVESATIRLHPRQSRSSLLTAGSVGGRLEEYSASGPTPPRPAATSHHCNQGRTKQPSPAIRDGPSKQLMGYLWPIVDNQVSLARRSRRGLETPTASPGRSTNRL